MFYLDENYLKLNRNLNKFNFKRRFREAISQPWFVYLFSLLYSLFFPNTSISSASWLKCIEYRIKHCYESYLSKMCQAILKIENFTKGSSDLNFQRKRTEFCYNN